MVEVKNEKVNDCSDCIFNGYWGDWICKRSNVF
jgi:hypothetical protein